MRPAKDDPEAETDVPDVGGEDISPSLTLEQGHVGRDLHGSRRFRHLERRASQAWAAARP